MLQTCGNQKPQEEDSFQLDDIDDDIDKQFCLTLMVECDVWSLCLNAAIPCCTHVHVWQTCGNQKPQEEDSFELGDIEDDIDEQLYAWLWCLIIMFERSHHARSYPLLFNMFTCELVIIYLI